MLHGQAASAFGRRHQQQDAFEAMITMTAHPAADQQQLHTVATDKSASEQQQHLSNSQASNQNNSRHTEHRSVQQQQQPEKRYRPQKFCSVCGDRAIACNFNAVTCESCKAFFRRNAYKEPRLKCLFESRCLITKDTRRFCSKCRLLKCFAIGMKREWILTDEQKHSKRVKIIQNKETKQRQLASVSAQAAAAAGASSTTSTKTSSSSFSSSSTAATPAHHLIGNAGRNNNNRYDGRATLMSSSPPGSGSSATMQLQLLCSRSEASSPTNNTTATKDNSSSLCSSREASISRSDSHGASDHPQLYHHHHQQQQQQQQTAHNHQLLSVVSPPPVTLFREARGFVETKDASTSTSALSGTDSGESALTTMVMRQQPNCSWLSQCHFCSMKMNNNNNDSNNNPPATAGSASSLGLAQQQQQTTASNGPANFANYSADQLGGSQMTATSRLFYSRQTGEGADETKHLQGTAPSIMATGTYGGAGAGLIDVSATTIATNQLLHQLSSNSSGTVIDMGGSISRPVTNYCFNADAGRFGPVSSMMADDPVASLQHHQNQYGSLAAGSAGLTYLQGASGEDGAGGLLSCFPVANQNGRYQQTVNHLPLMGAQTSNNPAIVSGCFVQAAPASLEHFSVPTAFSSRTSSSSDSGNCLQQPQQNCTPATNKSTDPEAATYELQMCSNLTDEQATTNKLQTDNTAGSLCSLGPRAPDGELSNSSSNSNHNTNSSSTANNHQAVVLAGCSPGGCGNGGPGDLTKR